MAVLKEVYQDYFKIGVACERITERFTTHEIGNPDKEALMAKQFSSMTFANELKPAYNMGFHAEEATEEFLPFVINPSAKAMLDWAVEHAMPVRGHVLVWHSQCPREIFCKGYEAVTFPTDPEVLKEHPHMKMFEKLNPVCYVDRQVLLRRLESYIHSLMEYMYANGYARTIYAWDVVNEAIELEDKTPNGLRNSYWYQIIGEDFIYYAFRYAKDAVLDCASRYEAKYGEKVLPALFYNDYNEWQPQKKQAILGMLGREGEDHGSILGEQLIDGIGMQGHLSDNNDIAEYLEALREYASVVPQVHITELDVKCTCTNANREYYQAVFYKQLFEGLLQAKREGVNLTCVTLWGLTDDNSWIRGADPLLFHKDLSEKKSFLGLIYAVTGESLGEPEEIIIDISDRHYDFAPVQEENAPDPEKLGFRMRGFGEICVQDRVVHSGRYALANERRFGGFSGISLDISDFIGQTVQIRVWVQSPAQAMTLNVDVSGREEQIAAVDTTAGEWSLIEVTYKVPREGHSMFLFFGTREAEEQTFSPMYVDDMEIKLLGMEESFEEKQHIASIRGMGHLPVLFVTDRESVDGRSHSLCVTRQEKDATVKLDISSYIGRHIAVSAFVKTADTQVRIGLEGAEPILLTEQAVETEGWMEVCAETVLPDTLQSAQLYVETDGNADLYLDQIWVRPLS